MSSTNSGGSENVELRPPRFSLEHVDREVDPALDFYSYAVGRWLKSARIPDDKSVWGAFGELSEYNLALLGRILEESARDSAAPAGSPKRLVGDFYTSGMDIERIERLGLTPIMDLLSMVARMRSTLDFTRVLAYLHLLGVPAAFSSYSRADRKNSGIYSFYLYQGGLSLPDREYYLSERFQAVLAKFREHVASMFALAGYSRVEAERRAGVVLDVEGALAKSSRPRAELRDPERNYNRVEWLALAKEYSNLHLDLYLALSGVPRVPFVVVGQPEYLAALDGDIAARPIDEWRVYLEWHVLHAFAPYLNTPFADEDFNFYHRVLLGQQKPEPRWKRIVRLTDGLLGEALGQLYVERYFPPQAREMVAQLVEDIKMVLRERIASSSWMSEQTKTRALRKLEKLKYRIGHPARFRDYSSVEVSREDFVGNIQRLTSFERRRQYSRVGYPVDRDEWNMSPPTVNAYYSPPNN
ncbi:MAG: M13 family metallopeptidase, partial [Thermoprotei archaeon]